MARPPISAETIDRLRKAVARGMGIRQAAREFRVDRWTVRKYIRAKEALHEVHSTARGREPVSVVDR